MQAASRRPQLLRSVGAIIAGALVGIILSLTTDVLLHAMGLLPGLGQVAPVSILVAATAYRTLYGILGAYLTAWIAPDRPMVHVTVLGSLGLMASLAGAIATWNKGPSFGPHWYPIALVVLALPTAWIGGWLRAAHDPAR